MKRMRLFLVLIVGGLGLVNGCSDQGNPVNTIVQGVYSGTYTIQQNQYTQQGVVTLTFTGTSYEQRGRVETPASPEPNFQESGTLKLESDTVVFNFGREGSLSMKMRVSPAWSLDGPFKYEYNNGRLTLEQNQGPWFTYRMHLQKQ